MNAQPGLKLDFITRFLTQGQFTYLQWASPPYEAGDFEARRNWGNFPNQCISSLMMKFPNPEGSLFLRMMSQHDLECKPDVKTHLLNQGQKSKYLLKMCKTLCLLCIHRVCQSLVAWVDDINLEVRSLNRPENTVGDKTKSCGRKDESDGASHGNAVHRQISWCKLLKVLMTAVKLYATLGMFLDFFFQVKDLLKSRVFWVCFLIPLNRGITELTVVSQRIFIWAIPSPYT